MGPRVATLAIAALSLLAFASCGSDADPVESAAPAQPVPDSSTVALPDGVPLCDVDATHPSAPNDWYRDSPKYVGNEQPTEAVQAWARTKPGFQQLWIDRDNNGWVTVGFDQDVEARQAEILEQFPNDGVVAVLVDWDLSELRGLQNRVTAHLSEQGVESFGVGASTQLGLVQISLGVLTEDRLAAVAAFAGDRICVEGLDPAQAILDGPQLQTGDGWRLLALEGTSRSRGEPPTPVPGPPPTPGGVIYGERIELATNPQQLETMWQAPIFGAATLPIPAVDFDNEVVVLASDIESGSCPVRFDGLQVADSSAGSEAALVLVQVVPDTFTMCTSDANTITYVIAIERSALPAGPFTIVGPASLWVDADLSIAGARVDDAATFAPRSASGPAGVPPTPAPLPPGFEPDPRPTAPIPTDEQPVEPDTAASVFPIIVEPGFSSTWSLPTRCFLSLGPVNGYVWQIESGTGNLAPPDEWLATVDAAGQIEADFLLQSIDGEDPQLQVTVGGLTETYTIIDGAPPAC